MPSNCTEAPVQEVHCWYFIQPPFPDTELSTASDSASRNMIFHVFGASDFFPPSYQEGETLLLSRSECKVGSEEQVPTISPVFSVALAPAAILHFSCNWSHISNTFTEMKQLRRSGVTLPPQMRANLFGCELILTWNVTKRGQANLDLRHFWTWSIFKKPLQKLKIWPVTLRYTCLL